MRVVKQKIILPKSTEFYWQKIEEVNSYPKLVKFVKSIKAYESPKVGGEWVDVTTIFWVSLKIKHRIAHLKKGQVIHHHIDIPLSGQMFQEIKMTKVSSQKTLLEVEVKFYFPNPMVDQTIGVILEKRVKQMISGTIKNLNQ